MLIEARERFQELTVAPGVADTTIFLGVAERNLGNHRGAAQHLLEALADPGINWSDDGDFWTLQFAASILADRDTAAVLVGAVLAGYERSDIDQPAFVTDDLAVLRRRLDTELDPDELSRHLRTGGRRTLQEAVDIGRVSLTQYLHES